MSSNKLQRMVGAFYLEDLLQDLKQRNSNHPLLALFEPVLETETEKLQQSLPGCYNVFQSNVMPQSIRDTMIKIFLDWVMQRFPKRSKDEISKMVIGQLTPLEQTRAWQELIAQGIEQGIEQGIVAGQVLMLEELLGLPKSKIEDLQRFSVAELEARKSELRSKLQTR